MSKEVIKLKKLDSKQIIIMIIVGIIIISTIVLYFCKNIINKEDDSDFQEDTNSVDENLTNNLDNTIEYTKIIVHITGAVKEQGIVILQEGDRIIDAIEAAGGETEDADLNKVNLAYVLQDGEKLYIPHINDSNEIEYISSDSGENDKTKSSLGEEKKISVNINTATKDELETLNGIGESTANKIIKYREENGKFKTIEDIKNVPGIGDAKFENIKDNIKIK